MKADAQLGNWSAYISMPDMIENKMVNLVIIIVKPFEIFYIIFPLSFSYSSPIPNCKDIFYFFMLFSLSESLQFPTLTHILPMGFDSFVEMQVKYQIFCNSYLLLLYNIDLYYLCNCIGCCSYSKFDIIYWLS